MPSLLLEFFSTNRLDMHVSGDFHLQQKSPSFNIFGIFYSTFSQPLKTLNLEDTKKSSWYGDFSLNHYNPKKEQCV